MNVFMKLVGATALATLVSFAAQAQDAKPNDGLNAALWYQTSVEYKTTAKSVYAGAQRLLDAAIMAGQRPWSRATITCRNRQRLFWMLMKPFSTIRLISHGL